MSFSAPRFSFPIETEADSLYLDVVRNPEDDTPRRILADWYEDDNQGLVAEFIRVQLELEGHRVPARGACRCDGGGTRCSSCFDDIYWQAHFGPLIRREVQLWSALVRERSKFTLLFRLQLQVPYLGCLPDYLARTTNDPTTVVSWRRGFPADVRCHHAIWRDRGRDMVAGLPIISVNLVDRQPIRLHGAPISFGWNVGQPDDAIDDGSYIHAGIARRMESLVFPSIWLARKRLHAAALTFARSSDVGG